MEKSVNSLYEQIVEAFSIEKKDIRQYSGLTLAYIGDSVYDMVIRTLLVEKGNAPVNKLHRRACQLVKAEAQAKLILSIQEDLTEEELAVYKRGRNAKSATAAKNASIQDYRCATGMEALLGYLYMNHQIERALELIKLGLEKIGENI